MHRLPSLQVNGEQLSALGSRFGSNSLTPVPEEINEELKCNESVFPGNGKIGLPLAGNSPRLLETKVRSDFDYIGPRVDSEDKHEKNANLSRRGPRPTKEETEKTAQQNWILTREIKDRFMKFEKIKKTTTIVLPENDPMDTIQARLQEVREMLRPQNKIYNILDSMSEEKRNVVLELADLPNDEYLARRRQSWRPIDFFRFAGRVVLLVIRSIKNRKRYQTEEVSLKPPIGSKTKRSVTARGKNVPEGRSCLGAELLLCLTTQPRFRTPSQIKKIRWMLRAAKAFKSLFPAEMESELARRVAYEKYDDGRVIGCQGRAPDRFYYILSGRVNILTQYDLSTGVVTKSLGHITKSMTTDPEELEKQWLLQSNLITKGQVEVLVLDKADFFCLTKSNAGPPIDYLRTLELFQEFPCERFLDQKDAIEYKYYSQNKVIVEDSNRTPWLYVVKSGIVKVVRIQSVADTRSDIRFHSQAKEDLGLGKSFSHADTMLGLLGKQRRMRTMIEDGSFKLPELPYSANAHAPSLEKHLKASAEVDHAAERGTTLYPPHRRRMSKVMDEDESLPSEPFSCLSVYKDSDDEDPDFKSPKFKRGKKETLPPLLGINIPTKETSSSGDLDAHSLWLTRERTKLDAVFSPRKKTSPPQRRTFLQLDQLKTGDVFGLDHMHETLASEGQGVSLVSDGAEVIKISKRFFLQNAANNTMLKVETMYKQYMSEEEASSVLQTKETWDKYRTELFSRMTKSVKRRGSMKREKTFT